MVPWAQVGAHTSMPHPESRVNQSCIFRVVQVIKSLQDSLEMGSMIMSIGSTVVAGLTGVPSTQTDRHTDHGTCDMCSKGPNICDECDAD